MNNSSEWSTFDTDSVASATEDSGSYLMKAPFLGRKKLKPLLHLLAWIILLALPLYFIKRWQVEKDFIWLYYINILIYGIIFYSNYLVLIPRFFFSEKRYRYFLSVIILVGCFYFVSDVSNRMIFKYVPGRAYAQRSVKPENEGRLQGPPPGNRYVNRPPFRQMHLYNYTLNSIFLIFFSLGLKILERQEHIEKFQKELEKEKLNSELAFLKNQISPHFFFNTLNNIYSLISINAEDSRMAVLKLSKLMRYLLYESEQGNTRLSSEIDFMINYIDLMKLRMSNKADLKISFPEKFEDKSIPPLLFITFIENAFKHGISNRGKSFIDISMISEGSSIVFKCSNSIANLKNEKEENSGIGLENIRKRLNLLFPGKHELKIDTSDNSYNVTLVINLA
ncbi:MAG: histidine kinase [Bacteroidales bacterium]